MYAVIKTGGKQYNVEVGTTLFVEKLEAEVGEKVEFDEVLLGKDGEAKVIATVEGQGKGKKVTVFKFKAKKNYRKKQGHRQPFTRVKIEAIEG